MKGSDSVLSVLALATDTSLLAAMFSSDLPPLFHQEKKKNPQRARQRDTERFKGWQQHHGLEVLSLPLTVLGREEEGGGREGGRKGLLE